MSSPSKIGKGKSTDDLVPLSMVRGRHFLLVFLLFLLLFIGVLGTTVNLGIKMKSKRRAVTLARISSSRSLLRYRKVLAKLLQGSSSAYSWAPSLSEKIQKSDWPGLYAWADSVTAEAYHDAAEYYAASQIAALLLKYPRDHRDLGLTTSPRDAAVNKFKLAEVNASLLTSVFERLDADGLHIEVNSSI